MAKLELLMLWLPLLLHYWWIGLLAAWIFTLCILTVNGEPPLNSKLWESKDDANDNHQ